MGSTSEDLMAVEKALLGPVALRPIFQERIWGADSLGPWYPKPAMGKPIGEVWLTAESCVAANGALDGWTLAEMARTHAGLFAADAEGRFPLLIKLLFPREKLSVQVHPNDEQARAAGDPRGKTECWYVLSAEPGAEVALGFKEGVSGEDVRAAIAGKMLEEKLRYVPVKAGDLVYVDAGTVHAIGPGMVVLETQQYSDVTFRLYDYGRPRELHVDQGLAVTRTETEAGLAEPVEMEEFTRLVSSPYFVVDRFALREGEAAPLRKALDFQILVALDEGCRVQGAGGALELPPGTAVLLPAEAVEYEVVSAGAAELIRIAER